MTVLSIYSYFSINSIVHPAPCYKQGIKPIKNIAYFKTPIFQIIIINVIKVITEVASRSKGDNQ